MTSHFVPRLGDKAEEDARIEGLRGIAALLVLFSHYVGYWTPTLGWFGFATTGVDLFFVLSGYVFAPYILLHKRLEWWPHLVRRFFRLYPLYIVALLVYALVKQGSDQLWLELLRHLFMAHTLGDIDKAFYFNPAFWSLPPEVEFYLLIPVVAFLIRHVGVWRFFWFALALRVALVAPGTSGLIEVTPRSISTVHLPGLLIEFMVGVLVFKVVYELRSANLQGAHRVTSLLFRLSSSPSRLAWLALAGMLFSCGLYGLAIAPGPAHTSTWPVLVTGNVSALAALAYGGVVLAVCARPDSLSLASRWLALRLGRLSYGIYLFHNAVPQLVVKAVPDLAGEGPLLSLISFCCTLVIAWAANHCIEEPARALGRSLSHHFSALRTSSKR